MSKKEFVDELIQFNPDEADYFIDQGSYIRTIEKLKLLLINEQKDKYTFIKFVREAPHFFIHFFRKNPILELLNYRDYGYDSTSEITLLEKLAIIVDNYEEI